MALPLQHVDSLSQFLFTNICFILYPSLENLTNHIAITLAQKRKYGVSHGGSPKFWGGLISPYGVVMDVPLIITTTSHHHATRQFLQVTQQWPKILYEIANLLAYFHAQLRWDLIKTGCQSIWARTTGQFNLNWKWISKETFVCNRGDTIQHHGGRSKELWILTFFMKVNLNLGRMCRP